MHDSFLRHYISQLSVVLCHGEPPGRLLLRESPVQAGPMRALVLSFSLSGIMVIMIPLPSTFLCRAEQSH